MISKGGLSWISIPDFVKLLYFVIAAVVEVALIGVVTIVGIVDIVVVVVVVVVCCCCCCHLEIDFNYTDVINISIS